MQQAQQAQQAAKNCHFSEENVADAEDGKRNSASSKRNTAETAENIADGEGNTPDKRNRNFSIKANEVADVADVALVPGNGRDAPPDDGLSIPNFLLRKPADLNGGTGYRCDHCGTLGATGWWKWPGRPDGIWLHSRCEVPWYDSEGQP